MMINSRYSPVVCGCEPHRRAVLKQTFFSKEDNTMKSSVGQEKNKLVPLTEVKETALSLGLKPSSATLRRVARGLSIIENVEHIENNTFRVGSQRNPTQFYRVSLGSMPSCTCQDWHKRAKGNGFLCKHVIATLLFEQQEKLEQLNAQAELLEQQFGPYLGWNNFIKW